MTTTPLCDITLPDIQYNVIRYINNKPSHYYYFGDEIGTKYASKVKKITIHDKIHPHDTLKIVFHKIAQHCLNKTTGVSIYAWYKDNDMNLKW